MIKTRLENIGLSILYKIIGYTAKCFPQTGKFFDHIVLLSLGESRLAKAFINRNADKLKHTSKLCNVCVIADVNIGDAINIQAIIIALHDYLPEAKIDYVINKKALSLIGGFPGIKTVYGIYTAVPLTTTDVDTINQLLENNKYDIVFNFCPFYSQKIILPPDTIEINWWGTVPLILKDMANPSIKAHMTEVLYKYIQLLFTNSEATSQRAFPETKVIISSGAVTKAESFIQMHGLGEKKIILLNPDTSSDFTRIPFQLQVSILEKLTELPCNILLAPGYNKKGIEHDLIKALPHHKQNKCTIIPIPLDLDVYAALIDHCDVFISGDTGPLHIAAAHKISRNGDFVFKNQTAIFSIFGGTPPRLYAFDSLRSGFVSSNQNAMSFTYEGNCYRNILYIINRNLLPFDGDYYFKDIDLDKIVMEISLCLVKRDNTESVIPPFYPEAE
jgi:ADP-heptose:LPS heptosyltransferase